MIEQLEYLHSNNIVHRDIKLENIIADKDMNLKLADFGFATDENIEELNVFRGTQSYMAPEIRNGDVYNGKETDIFSMGVVLFTLVVGYFPFTQASFDDKFYGLLLTGERDDDGINTAYWKTLKSSHLSTEFKDLMQQILGYVGNSRPTIQQIKEHPWFRDQIDYNQQEYLRQIILDCYSKGNEAKEWLNCYREQMQKINWRRDCENLTQSIETYRTGN